MQFISQRLGIDIGGTFTDIVSLGTDGRVRTLKIPSTPDDYGRAIVEGATRLLAENGLDKADVREIIHATTVVTNTVLEHKGARTAFVTTRGFRDLLGMRRLRIPQMYNLKYEKPEPLAPRRLCFEVTGRIGPDGSTWEELDETEIRQVAAELVREKVEAVAICLLHSYASDQQERRVEAVLAEVLGPDICILRSSGIMPEIREYERASTTVVSAYVAPVVIRYLGQLGRRLREAGLAAPLRVVQSNGGAMTPENALARPAHLLESGPAAGVIACARAAMRAGVKDAISLDMGGTTAKAAMIENGQPARTSEYEVGAGINLSSQLVKGGGYAVKLPFIDVSEIGAGGGSIVSLGARGTIQVGPQSAGAVPGPACYGRGGVEPTFTDAMMVLGYLNPQALAGGEVAVDAELARRVIAERVAGPLARPLLETAYGIYQLAAATMTRAVKAVTTYRGRDPRDFTLIAFGGNGPLAAEAIARQLDIRRILIPPAPGVFSAFGLPLTELEREETRSVVLPCCRDSELAINAHFDALEDAARDGLRADGVADRDIQIVRLADMRFQGQAYELAVEARPGPVEAAELARSFNAEHTRTYGHGSLSDPMLVINLRVLAQARQKEPPELLWAERAEIDTCRKAYFGVEIGALETPVISRARLSPAWRRGPLIIEEYDATCVVPPDAAVRLDALGNIEIDMSPLHG